MQNFLNKQELVVPTADGTANTFAMDVIGNKSDAAAAGAVTTTESLMAYEKQNVTNTEAAAVAIGVIDAFHDVPTQNAATNAQMRDVIGNKTDTLAGNSIYTFTNMLWGDAVQKAVTLSGNGATQINLFTFTGMVEIIEIMGVSTEATNSTTLSTVYWNAYDGTAAVDVTLNTGVDLSGITAGSVVRKNGANTAAAVYSKNDQVRASNNGDVGLILTEKGGATNYIRIGFTGDINTDVDVMFFIRYRAKTATAAITAV